MQTAFCLSITHKKNEPLKSSGSFGWYVWFTQVQDLLQQVPYLPRW